MAGLDVLPLAALLALPIGITLGGWVYYAAPLGQRLRHPLHALLRPSGPVGLALGALALLLFLFLWLYAIRRSVRGLAWTGAVASWLRVHVVAGLAVPVIAATHAGWRFEGLIGLGYWAMLAVAMSGVVGRFLYTHIPRRRSGVELTREEIAGERRALVTDIAAATGEEPLAIERLLGTRAAGEARVGPLGAAWRLLRDDLGRAAALRRLERELSRPRPGRAALAPAALRDALRLARREMALGQQLRVLDTTRRLLGWWHVFHRPFAITAFLAVLVHVIVAVVVGGVGRAGR